MADVPGTPPNYWIVDSYFSINTSRQDHAHFAMLNPPSNESDMLQKSDFTC